MRIIILIIIIAFCIKGNAQYEGYLICNFEESSESYLTIDKVNDTNNIWQIGEPGKSYLSSAYSSPNVIITDRIHTYPVNDTSSFYITCVAGFGFELNGVVGIGGYYKVDSDSLLDYGKIEISTDNGLSWFDPLSDSILETDIFSNKPTFTGRSEWHNLGYI